MRYSTGMVERVSDDLISKPGNNTATDERCRLCNPTTQRLMLGSSDCKTLSVMTGSFGDSSSGIEDGEEHCKACAANEFKPGASEWDLPQASFAQVHLHPSQPLPAMSLTSLIQVLRALTSSRV